MKRSAHATFPHRHNPDGTFDSICTQCFRTIATTITESELKAAEGTHDCFGFDLGMIIPAVERERWPNRTQQSTQAA